MGVAVAKYVYDAWGNHKIYDEYGAEVTSTSHVGYINPIRYRSYYFDTETGLYYLGARYYDPEVGRFINADSTDVVTTTLTDFTDKNLYAYCDNNPITRKDDGGEFWHIVAGAVIGGIASAVVEIVKNPNDINWASVAKEVIVGAATGALSASGLPVGVVVAANAGISAAESVYNDLTDGEKDSVGEIISNATVDAGISALFTYVGYSPTKGQSLNAMYKAQKSASKQILSGGLHPNVKVQATKTVKRYYKALGRFIGQEIKETPSSWFIGDSKKAFSCTFKGIANAACGW